MKRISSRHLHYQHSNHSYFEPENLTWQVIQPLGSWHYDERITTYHQPSQ